MQKHFRSTVRARFCAADCPKDCGDGLYCTNQKRQPDALAKELKEMAIVFTLRLPLGPTDNRRHTIAARRRMLIDTEEYRVWKDDAIREIKSQLPTEGWEPLQGSEKNQIPYRIQMVLPNRRTDVGNYLKGIQDVMKHAGVWDDDRWACPQFYPARIVAERGCILVTLPMTLAARAAMWPMELA